MGDEAALTPAVELLVTVREPREDERSEVRRLEAMQPVVDTLAGPATIPNR